MAKTEIIIGNCLEVLREMESESVHCVVTSPPYWGLRKYAGVEPVIWGGMNDCSHGWAAPIIKPCGNAPSSKSTLTTNSGKGPKLGDKYHYSQRSTVSTGEFCLFCNAWLGCLGLEPTPELYVEHLVAIFREVKRVLRRDGTVWLNLGDSYAGSNKGVMADGSQVAGAKQSTNAGSISGLRKTGKLEGLKPKDLCGIPWRVAFALQADGWWLRSDIIWHKPNCMPSSVKDRPTTSHEYVFLLAKSRRYYYDHEAIKEPASWERWGEQTCKKDYRGIKPVDMDTLEERRTAGRNKRTVWTISTKPYKEAHFATFPPALITPPIKAGTSEYGCCSDCGAGWVRVVERVATGKTQKMADGWATHEGGHGSFHRDGREHGEGGKQVMASQTTGWHPTCNHDAEPVPCVVLDPFGGAGTTALVANELGRDAILIEMSEEYSLMAKTRLETRLGLFADVQLRKFP